MDMVPGGGINVDAAARIDARGGVEPIALPGVEVVGAMGRSRMHGASASVGGDVGGEYAQDAAVEERMLEGDAVQGCALEACQFPGFTQLAGGDDGGGQLRSDNIDRAVVCGQGCIVEVGMEGHGQRCRK